MCWGLRQVSNNRGWIWEQILLHSIRTHFPGSQPPWRRQQGRPGGGTSFSFRLSGVSSFAWVTLSEAIKSPLQKEEQSQKARQTATEDAEAANHMSLCGQRFVTARLTLTGFPRTPGEFRHPLASVFSSDTGDNSHDFTCLS